MRNTFVLSLASCTITLSFIVLLPMQSFAQVKSVPSQRSETPLVIAVLGFLPESPSAGKLAASITRAVAADLRHSYARVLGPINNPEKDVDIDALPKFVEWQAKNVHLLVTGRSKHQSDGRLKTEFRLWDVANGLILTEQRFVTEPESWLNVARMITTQIHERLSRNRIVAPKPNT